MTNKTTRQAKTPRQRAQEQLDTATRHVDRLTKKSKTLRAELEAVEAEARQAIARRDYLAKHPDLAPNTSTATASTGATP